MKAKTVQEIESLRTAALISDAVAISLKTAFVEDVLGVKSDLYAKISEWEAKLGDDDKSLYSLGLRHANDRVDELINPKNERVV